jgi:hypothetical protein
VAVARATAEILFLMTYLLVQTTTGILRLRGRCRYAR